MAWFKCGGGGIPAALKSLMNAVLNKKWGTSGTYPPETWPETVNLMGPLEEKTVSGSIVTFDDGSDDVPLKKCEVTIPANLDGVSSVDVVHTGLQLLPVTIPSNGNGITYTDNGDGTFKASGTASATSSNRYVFTSTAMNTLKRGETYHISGCPSGGSSNTYKLQAWNASTSSQLAVDYGNGASFTMPTEGTINVRFVIYKGQEVDFTVKPMITAVQTTEHAEYNGTTHTASLGRVIYGGSADIVNGTGTDGYINITFDGSESEWQYQTSSDKQRVIIALSNAKASVGSFVGNYIEALNSAQGYPSEWKAWINASSQLVIGVPSTITSKADWQAYLAQNNLIVSYEKATATDFTFTPVPIISRLGDNTMWGDGDLEVVYRSSGTQTIITPTLVTKAITENGTYTAAADAADGYSSVVVDVPTGATNIETVLGDSPLIEITGVSGTDVTRTMWTRTAAQDETVVFHPNTKVKTNTGANDGFFKVLKNSVVVVSTYANTSTTTSLSIPDIDLEAGDVLTISAGFDNNHSSCLFDLYSTITILSSGSAPVLGLGLGNPGPVNEPEQEEEPDEAPEEIQEETPEEVDQNESNE